MIRGTGLQLKPQTQKRDFLTYDKYFQDFESRIKFTRNRDLPPLTSSTSGTVQLGVGGGGRMGRRGEGWILYCSLV